MLPTHGRVVLLMLFKQSCYHPAQCFKNRFPGELAYVSAPMLAAMHATGSELGRRIIRVLGSILGGSSNLLIGASKNFLTVGFDNVVVGVVVEGYASLWMKSNTITAASRR